ncbi:MULTISPECIES: hypothetical protein [Deefgea]|uniref:Protein CopB n=1 Tax=Deefgea piscis TaxID=2739061 RepID=A0A6M8SPL4_9NEIS|nr:MULTISPECIES: hypothetical protein [Deefgea]QKJ67193.1 hypothetical protein HQN60_11040 [Deefgea piscis]
MTMKKFELEKRKAEKLHNDLGAANAPARFGQAAATVLDKKEQRKQDQAKGLVPFACKLNKDLVQELHTRCSEREMTLNDLVAELIQTGLAK